MRLMVSQVDYKNLLVCMCTHACTAHKFMHASFSTINFISRNGDLKKNGRISFFWWFFGVCFLHLMIWYIIFFLIFRLCKNNLLFSFRGALGELCTYCSSFFWLWSWTLDHLRNLQILFSNIAQYLFHWEQIQNTPFLSFQVRQRTKMLFVLPRGLLEPEVSA